MTKITTQDGPLTVGSTWIGGAVPSQTPPYEAIEIKHAVSIQDGETLHYTAIVMTAPTVRTGILTSGKCAIHCDTFTVSKSGSEDVFDNAGSCEFDLYCTTMNCDPGDGAGFGSIFYNDPDSSCIARFHINTLHNTGASMFFEGGPQSSGDLESVWLLEGRTTAKCNVTSHIGPIVSAGGSADRLNCTLTINADITISATLAEPRHDPYVMTSVYSADATINGDITLGPNGLICELYSNGSITINGDVIANPEVTQALALCQWYDGTGRFTLNGRVRCAQIDIPQAKDLRYGVGSGSLRVAKLSDLRDFTDTQVKQMNKVLGLTGDTVDPESTGLIPTNLDAKVSEISAALTDEQIEAIADQVVAELNAEAVTVVAPYVAGTTPTLTLTRGDDYNSTTSNRVVFSGTTWPSLSGITVKLYIRQVSTGNQILSSTGTVAGTVTQTITCTLTRDQTNKLTVDNTGKLQYFEVVATFGDQSVRTLLRGDCYVLGTVRW